ncbi:hypothetical protein E2562_022058 [Oryza meyeriana var. granulata]|uniref:Uncharacterized protein n=1 Tax=Oryza meyeriana var. granulata TaxID=110450 RepID=A0A6G1ENN2_9ORYZ|nr:hypothetical protein E2562_022058 [Oryza meyeriana var. granulata]
MESASASSTSANASTAASSPVLQLPPLPPPVTDDVQSEQMLQKLFTRPRSRSGRVQMMLATYT